MLIAGNIDRIQTLNIHQDIVSTIGLDPSYEDIGRLAQTIKRLLHSNDYTRLEFVTDLLVQFGIQSSVAEDSVAAKIIQYMLRSLPTYKETLKLIQYSGGECHLLDNIPGQYGEKIGYRVFFDSLFESKCYVPAGTESYTDDAQNKPEMYSEVYGSILNNSLGKEIQLAFEKMKNDQEYRHAAILKHKTTFNLLFFEKQDSQTLANKEKSKQELLKKLKYYGLTIDEFIESINTVKNWKDAATLLRRLPLYVYHTLTHSELSINLADISKNTLDFKSYLFVQVFDHFLQLVKKIQVDIDDAKSNERLAAKLVDLQTTQGKSLSQVIENDFVFSYEDKDDYERQIIKKLLALKIQITDEKIHFIEEIVKEVCKNIAADKSVLIPEDGKYSFELFTGDIILSENGQEVCFYDGAVSDIEFAGDSFITLSSGRKIKIKHSIGITNSPRFVTSTVAEDTEFTLYTGEKIVVENSGIFQIFDNSEIVSVLVDLKVGQKFQRNGFGFIQGINFYRIRNEIEIMRFDNAVNVGVSFLKNTGINELRFLKNGDFCGLKVAENFTVRLTNKNKVTVKAGTNLSAKALSGFFYSYQNGNVYTKTALAKPAKVTLKDGKKIIAQSWLIIDKDGDVLDAE